MARWRLTGKHYIHVEINGNPTEWEYKETDMASGRQGRKIFKVPMLLDPESPPDHNYPGEIIVSYKPYNKDYVFEGEPTPQMEPLDDEAREISDSLKHKWVNPIDQIDMNYQSDYSQSLLTKFERMIDETRRMQKPVEPVSLDGVDSKAFAALQAQVAELMKANAEFQAKALEKPLRRI